MRALGAKARIARPTAKVISLGTMRETTFPNNYTTQLSLKNGNVHELKPRT